jgi:hypothetical protein
MSELSTAYDASTYFSVGLEPELQRLKAQVEISWRREATVTRSVIASSLSPDFVGAALVATGPWSQADLDDYRAALSAFCSTPDAWLLQSRPVAWGRSPG